MEGDGVSEVADVDTRMTQSKGSAPHTRTRCARACSPVRLDPERLYLEHPALRRGDKGHICPRVGIADLGLATPGGTVRAGRAVGEGRRTSRDDNSGHLEGLSMVYESSESEYQCESESEEM